MTSSAVALFLFAMSGVAIAEKSEQPALKPITEVKQVMAVVADTNAETPMQATPGLVASDRALAPQAAASATIPEQLLSDLQADFNLTEAQAAGIVGNLAHESGNFRILKQINGSCYGYPQWCGQRKTSFKRFASDAGGPESYHANYGFLKYELKTQYQAMMVRIRKAETVDAAAKIFMKEFLRPNAKKANLGKRVAYARTYLAGDFRGAGCFIQARQDAKNKPTPCRPET